MSNANNPSRLGPKSPNLLAVAMIPLSFLVAYALDEIGNRLHKYASETFDFPPFILFSAIVPLLVVTGILGLAWLLLCRVQASRAVAVGYLIAGLFVVFEYVAFLLPGPSWLRTAPLRGFTNTILTFGSLGSGSSIYYLASSWIVIAVAALRRSANTPVAHSRPFHGAA